MSIEITRRQTTFWELRKRNGELARVHFIGKEEFRFVERSAPLFSIVQEHPVLIDYDFAWENIYLSSPTSASDQICGQLKEAIETKVNGWRSADHYFNALGAERLLREGFGLLVNAPLPITEICVEILESNNIRFSCLPGKPCPGQRQALIAGRNFVVAQSFRDENIT